MLQQLRGSFESAHAAIGGAPAFSTLADRSSLAVLRQLQRFFSKQKTETEQ
jgi:hypothetical protein